MQQASIATALAGLTKLRVLRIHLDLNAAPNPWMTSQIPRKGRPFGMSAVNDETFIPFVHACNSAAGTFASLLAPSVEWVCILHRRRSKNSWSPYRIFKDGSDARAECRRDHMQTQLNGLS